MALSFAKEAVPLQADEDGVVRVGKTRVTLDTVVAAFSDGATAEEIVQQYPILEPRRCLSGHRLLFAPAGGGRSISAKAQVQSKGSEKEE